MDRALKVLKIFSLIIFLVVILAVYAYLPRDTSLFYKDLKVSKTVFFYGVLILFSLVNFLFAIQSGLFKGKKASSQKVESLRSWFLSLPIMFNFYLIFMVGYIGVINNGESVDPSSYFYLVYLGPVLVLVWLFALVRLLLTSKSVNH